MPRIFDNIEKDFLPILQDTLRVSEKADFCVGYFNLRGWQKIDAQVELLSGKNDHCCRVLIGMQRLPETQLHDSLSLLEKPTGIDNRTVISLKQQVAQDFYQQLILGAPTNQDEAGLRRLKKQIQQKKVVIKLFLRYPLHAKLYLLYRQDINNPIVGFLGSSNLTLSGLQNQGELNIDVLDHDACEKLQKWFNDRWNDRWCLDISQDIINIIDQSWARESLIPPYHIYLKMAYHLSTEARVGLSEYHIPKSLQNQLFDFQIAAVKIAARHVNKRGGVLVGDVVGLGKTRIAATLAKILEDEFFLETLIICPKNLVSMWEDYVHNYQLRAKVISVSNVQNILPQERRYRVVLIDESHNLRNRNGKRYRAIQDYITLNESRCILLTATPYNKTYLDLSSQLRLFIPDDKDLGFRPERLLQEIGGEPEFHRKYQSPIRSLAAFEYSEYPDDWRDLMRFYMVRRTRGFIQKNYTKKDAHGRQYLQFFDGTKSYFPTRKLKTLQFQSDVNNDAYGMLYCESVVNLLSNLHLPRYGLGNYIISEKSTKSKSLTAAEIAQLKDLSRAGKRLKGFCRTNLFKRLESGGFAFLQSLDRHILRNYIFLYAIAHKLPLPIGSQDTLFLDTRYCDQDIAFIDDNDDDENDAEPPIFASEDSYNQRATQIYNLYQTRYKKRFKWIDSQLFKPALKKDLQDDATALMELLKTCGKWQCQYDQKLQMLTELLTEKHPQEKVLIFSQFADTVEYLTTELQKQGIAKIAGVTGNSADPAAIAHRFSPESNHKSIPVKDQLRIIITTDILSEGLNLQDCAIIVNYDLPWAIIRLIQRAGRIDRIGQNSPEILCYSFLPVEGVENIIKLRSRLMQRLQENAEVVGTDEAFFEDEVNQQIMLDLYHEKSDLIDQDEDTEVDLISEAYQIWKNAIDQNPSLQKIIENIANVSYSTRHYQPNYKSELLGELAKQEGVLLYLKTAEGNDSLAWINREGKSVTQSQFAILKAAACEPETPAINKDPQHHQLVEKAAELIAQEEKSSGGQLGRPSSAKYKTYQRLKRYSQEIEDMLFNYHNINNQTLKQALTQIYQYPLRNSAVDRLNRVLKMGVNDQQLAELVIALYMDDQLCIIHGETTVQEPQIICSLGLFSEPLPQPLSF